MNIHGGFTTLNLVAEVLKYQHEESKKNYFGIYYVVEIDGGCDLMQTTSIYTKGGGPKELSKALKRLCNTFSKEKMQKIYDEAATYDPDRV